MSMRYISLTALSLDRHMWQNQGVILIHENSPTERVIAQVCIQCPKLRMSSKCSPFPVASRTCRHALITD